MNYTSRTFLLIAITSQLLFSCNHKKKEMIMDLTNSDYKYWYRYHKDTLYPYPLGFCFFNDGTFVRYFNENWDKTKRVFYSHPVLSEPVWKILNDSLMIFGKGDTLKIVALNRDSIILSDKHDTSFLKLKRDQDQVTKPVRLE